MVVFVDVVAWGELRVSLSFDSRSEISKATLARQPVERGRNTFFLEYIDIVKKIRKIKT